MFFCLKKKLNTQTYAYLFFNSLDLTNAELMRMRILSFSAFLLPRDQKSDSLIGCPWFIYFFLTTEALYITRVLIDHYLCVDLKKSRCRG